MRLRTRHDQDVFAARGVDAQTLLVAATGRHKLTPIRGDLSSAPLAVPLGGHLPERINEAYVQVTFDTAENRFVKSFLRGVQGIISRMREVIAENPNPDAFSRRILVQCEELERSLKPVGRALFWNRVGPLVHVSSSSTVLQNRRGYRDVFRHFVKLRSASRVPFSDDLMLDLLEAKDVAQLYETLGLLRDGSRNRGPLGPTYSSCAA